MAPTRQVRIPEPDLPYVVAEHHHRIGEIENDTRDLAVLRDRIAHLSAAIDRLTAELAKTREHGEQEVSKLKNAVIAAALALVTTGVGIALTQILS